MQILNSLLSKLFVLFNQFVISDSTKQNVKSPIVPRLDDVELQNNGQLRNKSNQLVTLSLEINIENICGVGLHPVLAYETTTSCALYG